MRLTQEQGVVVRQPESALRQGLKQELAAESGEENLEDRIEDLEDNLEELSKTLRELTEVVHKVVVGAGSSTDKKSKK